MINIVSKSLVSSRVGGPQKVVKNLIKGLDLLGYPYVINGGLDSCARLWIHDDKEAFGLIDSLGSEIKVVVGPNLYLLKDEIPSSIDLSRVVYLHPCLWSKQFWIDFGFNRCKLDVWPTGIDTAQFRSAGLERDTVLLYYKQRSAEELNFIEKILNEKGVDFILVKYGSYKEKEYKKNLSRSRYVVWLGRQESQGIALQESLSCDVPILVCDVTSYGHRSDKESLKFFTKQQLSYSNVTSAPYFDERCGIKIRGVEGFGAAVDFMENNFKTFKPRQFVEENLNLKRQALELIKKYEIFFGLSISGGYDERLLKTGKWKNSSWAYLFKVRLKDLAITILAKFGLY